MTFKFSKSLYVSYIPYMANFQKTSICKRLFLINFVKKQTNVRIKTCHRPKMGKYC